jgi:hypothetical protein
VSVLLLPSQVEFTFYTYPGLNQLQNILTRRLRSSPESNVAKDFGGLRTSQGLWKQLQEDQALGLLVVNLGRIK